MPKSSVQQIAASLLKRLLKLSSEAAEAGEYEVAYHSLMAALHAAERARSLEGIEKVVQMAQQQEAGLEAIRPAHPLSSQRAKLRRTQPLYRTLPVHAEALRLRLKVPAHS